MMITCKSLQVLDQISLIGRWLHLVVHVHLKLFLYVWDFTHIVVIIETYTFIHTSTSVCCVCLWLLLTQWNSIFGVPLINSTDIGQDIPTSFFSLSTLTTPSAYYTVSASCHRGQSYLFKGVSESLVTWKHMIEHISIGRMEFHLPK